MQGPINFDFGKHWEGLVTPWLDDPRVQRSLKQGMNQYLRDTARKKRYKSGTCPASHSMGDFYAVLMEAQEERLLEDLRAQGLLPKWYLRLEERLESCDQDSDDEQDLAEEVMQARDSLLEPFFNWDMIKYDIESYYVVGACHWLAPTFELTLAQLVCPEETWHVQSSDKHSTVINTDQTKVFDLLYWGLDDRLENYIFGGDRKESDETLGGREAHLSSI